MNKRSVAVACTSLLTTLFCSFVVAPWIVGHVLPPGRFARLPEIEGNVTAWISEVALDTTTTTGSTVEETSAAQRRETTTLETSTQAAHGAITIAFTTATATTSTATSTASSGAADPCLRSKIPFAVCKELRLTTLPHSRELFNNTKPHPSYWRTTFKLLHIEKTGGTTIERLLDLGHQAHTPIVNQKFYTTKKWITVVRDPIERMSSAMYFWVSGEFQAGYKDRQAKICKAGTGKFYHKPCELKVSLYQFSKMEPLYCNLRGWRFVGGSMSSVPDCPQIVVWQKFIKYFWLLGPNTRMDELLALIIDGLGLKKPLQRSYAANVNKINKGANSSLTPSEYEALAKENHCDFVLLKEAGHFLDQLIMDYGQERMRKRLASAPKAAGTLPGQRPR